MINNQNQEPPPQNGPPPMATAFSLRHHMIQQVQNTCQFHGFPGDDANRHIDKFLKITQNMKQNGVSDDALHLSFFPYHAIAWYYFLPRNSIHSFDDMMRKFLLKYFPPSMVTKLRNEITKFEQKPHELLFEAWEPYKLSIDRCSNHNMLLVTQIDTFYNGLTLTHRDTINAAAGGTFMQKTPEECDELIENMTDHHNHWDTSAIRDETSRNISSASTSTTESIDMKCETCGGPHSFTECLAIGGYTQETDYATTSNYNSGGNSYQPQGTGSLSSNTIPNPREDLKVITTCSGVTLAGPSVSPSKEVNREPEMITDHVLIESTNNVPPLVVQLSPASTSFSKNSSSKIPEVTKDTKLFDLATTPMNENCSTVILRKLHKKLGDPGKFLIPCDFPEFDECLALADLGASINLMPLSIWKTLSFPELTSTQMILEPTDRSTTRPAGIAKDVFVKVGKFHFPTDFVVVDYVVDPRVPLILGRPFLRIERSLIDVYGEELTLRVDDEAITFKVGQTLKYSYNNAESINRIDGIDVACEEYVQEVLGFCDNCKSGNTTPTSDPIIALSSPSLTPFEGGDFILEDIEACLISESIPLGIDDTDLDLEGDILLLEELLNNDPLLSPLPLKELNVEEIKTVKSLLMNPQN
uniref:Reverse transcriptase domain-containing protein n=1 Tax=Tanacetum cinerariifolium TaxID=118510 RepID=A0A6L2JCN2_TANCI|nr:reverse transcriptase domain-containing protein [Tanacetum cinerariifolium]